MKKAGLILIGFLILYAALGYYGYLKTPHRCVVFGNVDEVPLGDWCDSIFESDYWNKPAETTEEIRWQKIAR